MELFYVAAAPCGSVKITVSRRNLTYCYSCWDSIFQSLMLRVPRSECKSLRYAGKREDRTDKLCVSRDRTCFTTETQTALIENVLAVAACEALMSELQGVDKLGI
jgi:hypothetical protein